jgi:hypothetical protein
MKRASSDVGIIFVVYNLRRIINILGKDKLKALSFVFCPIMAHFKAVSQSSFFNVRKILLKDATLTSILLPNFNLTFSLKIAPVDGY